MSNNLTCGDFERSRTLTMAEVEQKLGSLSGIHDAKRNLVESFVSNEFHTNRPIDVFVFTDCIVLNSFGHQLIWQLEKCSAYRIVANNGTAGDRVVKQISVLALYHENNKSVIIRGDIPRIRAITERIEMHIRLCKELKNVRDNKTQKQSNSLSGILKKAADRTGLASKASVCEIEELKPLVDDEELRGVEVIECGIPEGDSSAVRKPGDLAVKPEQKKTKVSFVKIVKNRVPSPKAQRNNSAECSCEVSVRKVSVQPNTNGAVSAESDRSNSVGGRLRRMLKKRTSYFSGNM